MKPEDVVAFGSLFLVGMLGLVMGILIWTGRFKWWFVVQRIPVILPTAFYNGSMVFLGLTLISAAVAGMLGKPGLTLFWTLSCPLLITTVALAIWQPKWIVPAWYRWLEENHGGIIPTLQEEVRGSGPGPGIMKWQRRVSTQEGLEKWVEEVRHKHGLS